MKVIVTGSSGLLGKSLQKITNLKNNDTDKFYFLTKSDCDLTDMVSVKKTFLKIQPDIVIHLASMVGGVYENMSNNYNLFLQNTRINTNIIDACNICKVKKLINILSTCIFPDQHVTYPLTPEQIHNGPPHYSNIGYAYSKRILHIGSSLLPGVLDGTTKVINIIPTNLYGDNDNYNIKKAHVIPALIHKTYLAKINNTPLVINGSGNALRQFLYIDDLSNIIYNIAIDKNDICRDLIVCPPKSSEISIKSIVDKIVNIFDFDGEVIYNSSESDGQIKKTSESDKEFADYKFTDINIGLINTIAYFVNNYENLRT
jgi:GDP-L-fucose synthase